MLNWANVLIQTSYNRCSFNFSLSYQKWSFESQSTKFCIIHTIKHYNPSSLPLPTSPWSPAQQLSPEEQKQHACWSGRPSNMLQRTSLCWLYDPAFEGMFPPVSVCVCCMPHSSDAEQRKGQWPHFSRGAYREELGEWRAKWLMAEGKRPNDEVNRWMFLDQVALQIEQLVHQPKINRSLYIQYIFCRSSQIWGFAVNCKLNIFRFLTVALNNLKMSPLTLKTWDIFSNVTLYNCFIKSI